MKSDVILVLLIAVLAVAGFLWFYLEHPWLALGAEIMAGLLAILFVRKRSARQHPRS